MCRFLSVGAILFVTMGFTSTTFAYDSMGTLDPSTRQVVTALLYLLVIIISATVYYQSKNMNSVLLYSGIAVSVYVVISVTGQPPLPGVIHKSVSKLGILPTLALLSIVLFIIGKEAAVRLKPWINTWNSTSTFIAREALTYAAGRAVGILYHGTPKIENARDIIQYGFWIGAGNSNGSGLYLGDFQTAKGYAHGTGVVVKVKLDAPVVQIVDFNSLVNSSYFNSWVLTHSSGNRGDDITNYAIQVLKKRFLKVTGNFYVALARRTDVNERVVFEGISVLGVLDLFGNPI